ncbi:hypothetical protein CERSUDRAFT_117632, partial [Gelatoporia subvermispora B]
MTRACNFASGNRKIRTRRTSRLYRNVNTAYYPQADVSVTSLLEATGIGHDSVVFPVQSYFNPYGDRSDGRKFSCHNGRLEQCNEPIRKTSRRLRRLLPAFRGLPASSLPCRASQRRPRRAQVPKR